MQNLDDRLRVVAQSWRNSLIDLSGKNRLLNYRHTRSATLEIKSPDAASLLAHLDKGIPFADIYVSDDIDGDEPPEKIAAAPYGPDQHGKFNMNFGPLNKGDGWRRLNVAVTRARYRVDVVASFTASTIPDSDNVSRQHLKRYLEYAERGPAVLPRQVIVEEAAYESTFEESVATVLRCWGYDVVPQVGVAGYRIDLGIRHPDEPARRCARRRQKGCNGEWSVQDFPVVGASGLPRRSVRLRS